MLVLVEGEVVAVDKMVDRDMVLVPVLGMAKPVGMDLMVRHMPREAVRVEVVVEDNMEVLALVLVRGTVRQVGMGLMVGHMLREAAKVEVVVEGNMGVRLWVWPGWWIWAIWRWVCSRRWPRWR